MHILRSLPLVLVLLASGRADDWPQWMGPRRDDCWRETGIIERFPAAGPTVLWRSSIQGGYCGPAVAGNRLFVLDRPTTQAAVDQSNQAKTGAKTERVLCFDASTGKIIWEHSYPCSYNIGYPAGPRATPTVAEGRVFTLGAMGDLLCLLAHRLE